MWLLSNLQHLYALIAIDISLLIHQDALFVELPVVSGANINQLQVNKGPDSAGVVAAAQKLGALAVRGNHDDAALAAYLSHKRGHKVKVTSWRRYANLDLVVSFERRVGK